MNWVFCSRQQLHLVLPSSLVCLNFKKLVGIARKLNQYCLLHSSTQFASVRASASAIVSASFSVNETAAATLESPQTYFKMNPHSSVKILQIPDGYFGLQMVGCWPTAFQEPLSFVQSLVYYNWVRFYLQVDESNIITALIGSKSLPYSSRTCFGSILQETKQESKVNREGHQYFFFLTEGSGGDLRVSGRSRTRSGLLIVSVVVE